MSSVLLLVIHETNHLLFLLRLVEAFGTSLELAAPMNQCVIIFTRDVTKRAILKGPDQFLTNS